jgi:hypothetical protein
MKKTKYILCLALAVLLLSIVLAPSPVSADDGACGMDILPGMPWIGANNTYFTLWAQNCEGKYWEFTINGETVTYGFSQISNTWSRIDIRSLGVGTYIVSLNLYSEAPTADMQDPFGPYTPLPVSHTAVFEIWEHTCRLDIGDQIDGQDILYGIEITSPKGYAYTIGLEKEVVQGQWEQIYAETTASSEESIYTLSSSFSETLFAPGSYRARLKIDYYLAPYVYFDVLAASQGHQGGGGNGQEDVSGAPDTSSGPDVPVSDHRTWETQDPEHDAPVRDTQTGFMPYPIKKRSPANRCSNPSPNTEDELNETVAIFIDRPRDETLIIRKDYFEIVGWAIDTHCCHCNGHSGTGIAYVSIYDDQGNVLSCAEYGLVRKDVRDAYGKNYLRSGFSARIKSDTLSLGANELTIYAYSPSIHSWSKTNITVFIK